jgi:hypothetical protein
VARFRLLSAALAAGALVPLAALAHGRPSTPAAAAPLPGLPAYTAGYRSWQKVNRAPIPPRRDGDAHLGTKNVYASRRPVDRRYPYGTVIVKEAMRPGTRFVGLIAVMRKVRGASRRNNDWVMIEWVRDARSARFGEIARGQVCYACHVGARANDYVFTRR